MFLFGQGKYQLGRSNFEEALKIVVEDNDSYRRDITDTYLMWAKLEREHNNIDDAERAINSAKGACSRIGNKISREEMQRRIADFNKPAITPAGL